MSRLEILALFFNYGTFFNFGTIESSNRNAGLFRIIFISPAGQATNPQVSLFQNLFIRVQKHLRVLVQAV